MGEFWECVGRYFRVVSEGVGISFCFFLLFVDVVSRVLFFGFVFVVWWVINFLEVGESFG